MPTRRRFVVSTSTAFLALAAAPRTLLSQGAGSDVFANGYLGAYIQGQLTKARFEAVIGSTFRLFHPDGTVSSLRLLQAASTPIQSAASSGGSPRLSAATSKTGSQEESFYAQFSSDVNMLPQGTYVLDHGTLGRFSAFLVPGIGASGATCTATFNFLSSAMLHPAPVRGTPIVAMGRLSF